MSNILEIAAAKSDKNDNSKWLSFQMHSLDTSEIIEKIFLGRVPESVRRYISINLYPNCNDIVEIEENTVQFCKLLALLHDIGKLTYVFQNKISKNINGLVDIFRMQDVEIGIKCPCERKTPHNIAGKIVLKENKFPREICDIIGAHHGMLNFNEDIIIKENFFGSHTVYEKDYNCKLERRWRNSWKEWVDFSLKHTGFKSVDELPKPNIKIQMLLTGLLIMSDWISSNSHYFPLVDLNNNSGKELKDISRDRADEAWERIDFPEYWQPCFITKSDLQDFFERRFLFKPNEIQNEIMQIAQSSCGYGLFILEAPMGTGKTEAALAAAEILAGKSNQGGIFFGLPTQATSNGVFSRVHNWIDEMSEDETYAIRLAHGMIDLNEEYQSIFHGTANESEDIDGAGAFVHEWFEGRKQALLSDFVVATVDQFLLASLKQRHVMLRHLGLAGKVVIIDECHAYDSYMNVYLDNTLTWMGAYKVPVILLSATLPSDRREEFINAYMQGVNGECKKQTFSETLENKLAYPALTWTDGCSVKHEKILMPHNKNTIKVKQCSENSISDILLDRLSGGGCAAIIVNTVRKAQQLAEILSDKLVEYEVICFHSRFIATDRADIENQLIKRVGKSSVCCDRNKLIVVGTQVMEQSLDLDFDVMITELCPMDLLLQRIGRLQRHKRERPDNVLIPEIYIMDNIEDGKNKVYSSWILYRTRKNMPTKITIPDDIPELVNKVYAPPLKEEEDEAEYQEFEREEKGKIGRANEYCIDSKQINSKRSTLAKILANKTEDNMQAEATVRDSEETIEVIVLCDKNDGKYGFVSKNSENILLDSTVSLSEEQANKVARERIRLPAYFARYYFDETEKLLNCMPVRWQENPYLRGELLMLLDENMEVTIAGKKLRYDNKYGLIDFEEEGKNG